MIENAPPAPPFVSRILRAWPWFVAACELVALSCFGVAYVANELRVALSYQVQTPARDVVYARYEACLGISALIARWTIAILIPVLVGQCLAWSWIRRAVGNERRAARLMPLTTVIGLLLLAFVGFLYSVAVSASMIG